MKQADWHKINLEIGLSKAEVAERQQRFGINQLAAKTRISLLGQIIETLREPTLILLIIAGVIYLILGESHDGIFMFSSIVVITIVHIFQSWRTDKSLEALKDLAAPQIDVRRDGERQTIASVALVPGDLVFINEGLKIPADVIVVEGMDLKVDESTLTGEPEGVWKVPAKLDQTKPTEADLKESYCYAGTYALQGSALAIVDKIGLETAYGKISHRLAQVDDSTTPLQRQVGQLIKICGLIAVLFLFLVVTVTFFGLKELPLINRLGVSIVSGVTLAIALIPEELPIVLTVFLSMGAWRLSQKKSLIRQISAVETLGAVSILCVDKTGTLTLNRMTVSETWSPHLNEIELAQILGMACEVETYDPMEEALIQFAQSLGLKRQEIFAGELIKDYPFDNNLKMMGHAWQVDDEVVVAVKGSEAVLKLCDLTTEQKSDVKRRAKLMASQEKRVLTVALADGLSADKLPNQITKLPLRFIGLVALVDPPRPEVKAQIAECLAAGIRVVMITGDSGITAASIASQVGIPDTDLVLTGQELDGMDDAKLAQYLPRVNVFSRVTPEHKLRLVMAFKTLGGVTAMTGDGVNDAPALKNADVGIAMSLRGSDVAREAADLILLDDNFTTIVDTIKDGRRIYSNIKKSVGYILTIHIPIALVALAAPLLGIAPANLLLLPIHVVLLELIIDPTCSVLLEREPLEPNAMLQKPRSLTEPLVGLNNWWRIIFQGLSIFAGSFASYYYLFLTTGDATLARSVGFAILVLANLFLAQLAMTGSATLMGGFKAIGRDWVSLLIYGIMLLAFVVIFYTPVSSVLRFTSLGFVHSLMVVVVAFVTTFWVRLLPKNPSS